MSVLLPRAARRLLAPLAPLVLASAALAQPAFEAPDAGPDAAPYTCTFHWFRTADGRIVGMDVIRSGDTGRLGLRLFLADAKGGLRALIHEAPAGEWEPFATATPPRLDGPGNALGRGRGWIAGRVEASGESAIRRAAFHLEVTPVTLGCPAGDFGLDFVQLSALDFPRVRTRGRLVIDDEELAIDAEGPCSIHYGRALPDYAYLATVPVPGAPRGPGLLLASTRGDNLRKGSQLAGSRAFTYAHFLDLPGDLPHLKFVSLRELAPTRAPAQARYHFPVLGVPAFGKTVRVTRVLSRVEHTLLGRPTTTYLAEVELSVPRLWPPLVRERHRVLAIGDVRGEVYQAHLGLGSTTTATSPTESPAPGLVQGVEEE